jgi:hypothetical protein
MKKLGLLVMVLVLVVASLGVGYALWSEQLSINSSVTTGDLNVIFDGGSASVLDSNGDPIGTITPNAGRKTATLTITHAYPGATCSVPIILKNVGTIPAVTGPYYWMAPAGDDEYFVIANPSGMPIDLPVSTDQVPANFNITINDWVEDLDGDTVFTTHPLLENTAYSVTINLDIFQGAP